MFVNDYYATIVFLGFVMYVSMFVYEYYVTIVILTGFNLDAVASADNRESTILAALENGAVHYTVKPVCFSDVKNLWGLVLGANETTRLDSNNNITNRRASVDGKSSSSTDGSNNSKRKRSSEGGKSTYISRKKHKVEWTSELQDRFLEAINYIGLDSKLKLV